MAIQFLVHQSDSTPEGEALYIRCQKLLDTLTSWCHSLGKSIAIQRQEHSTKVVEEIHLPKNQTICLTMKTLMSGCNRLSRI